MWLAFIIIMLNQSIRRMSTRPRNAKINLWKMMAPHSVVAGLFLATSNAHLVVIPATTAALHYLYKFNHFKKATLYYDMQKLGKNENYVATFEKIREILLTDARFEIYIEQRVMDNGGSDKERSTTLIFENPTFMPFSYKMEGMVGKLDEERRRFSFDCSFRDLIKGSQGRVNALIVFNSQKEAFFESLTVTMEEPRFEKLVITESTESLSETEPHNLREFNLPKKYADHDPKPKPRNKYT